MAKTLHFKSASGPELNRRKTELSSQIRVPANAMRASLVRQFLTCGKKNCRCQRGHKHGPFHYLVQCMGVGSVRKFLLKTPEQREQARISIAAYAELQERLEVFSQINTELLHRGELLKNRR